MNKATIEQFQQIISKFASAKIMTQDDIETILAGVLKIMNSFKKGNETLNTETKKTVSDLLEKLTTKQEEITKAQTDLKSLSEDDTKKRNQTTENILQRFAEIEALYEEFTTMRPKDGDPGAPGETPNVDEIIEQVLLEVYSELPDQEESETGATLIEKINSEKDKKIKASQIEGLPKVFTREVVHDQGGRAGAYETLIVDSNGKPLSKTPQGAFKLPPISGGGGFTFINEIVSGSGTSFTLANVPVDSTKVALYGGGSRLTPGVSNDYTISGAAITMTNSYSSGQVLADYS